MAKKEIVAGKCIGCQRELRVHPNDDPLAALKRKNWSNIPKGITLVPLPGICPSCRKHGMHRR